MARSTVLFLAVSAVVLVAFGSGASAAPRAWPPCSATSPYSLAGLMEAVKSGDMREKVWVHVCGPTSVIPGRDYSYTVVFTNISDTTYRRLKLSVSHYDPLTRASLPYRREAAANGDPVMQGAAWRVMNFKPGRSFRVSFTLLFKQHRDPVGSNFDVELGPNLDAGAFPHCPCSNHSISGMTHDVVFIRPASQPT